ncbi:hypothetical protein NDU88_004851 [Pleurodeles waltl]|uniref:Uncharacterized protein n=1 Tax=Pleurodeles waltl TaxID=8319 RepID=A0AAV7VHF1_PLEWA|nr:hypothetical protein NDU88_004851 [Pleurodeles waltl]
MRSGKVRKEHPNPPKRKKCRCSIDVGSATPHSPPASAISAALFSSAADPPSSAITKFQLSSVLMPHPRPSKLRESSLLSYFKKKPKLELLANGGEIMLESGQSVLMEPAVTDPLPIACGYFTTVAQVYCPATPVSPVFSQLASQSEVSHSPPLEDQPAVLLSKHGLSPIFISSEYSSNAGEWVPSLAASPAALHRLAGQDGLTVGCHDFLQDHSILLPSSPPVAQWIRSLTGSIHPMLPTRSSSGAAHSSQSELIKGELNHQSLLYLSCLQSDPQSGANKEPNPVPPPWSPALPGLSFCKLYNPPCWP